MTGPARPADWPTAGYDRLECRLTYAEAGASRRMGPWGIDGPDLPSARGGDRTQPGDWSHDIADSGGDPVRQALAMVVAEAVHEALEWLHLDSEPLLDPHGPGENDVHQAVAALNDRLWEIACTKAAADSRPGSR